MTDAPTIEAETDDVEAEMSPEQKAEIDKLVTVTKKNFDLRARVRGRGLRKAGITLYLDEEKGPELGWAYDRVDQFGNAVGRIREGVLGELDLLNTDRDLIIDQRKAANALVGPDEQVDVDAETPLDKQIKALEKKRDKLIEELTKSAIVVKMKAVPPIVQKGTRRKAKKILGITGKGIPEDKEEMFQLAEAAFLMIVMIESVTDNETGETNEGVDYDDAIDLIGYLPAGQWARLDAKLGEVQFVDAISRTLEAQEDFS